jgi:hypothetical protein
MEVEQYSDEAALKLSVNTFPSPKIVERSHGIPDEQEKAVTLGTPVLQQGHAKTYCGNPESASNFTSYLETALPPSPERDRIIGLVNLALSFEKQQVGRRPGPFKTYLLDLVQRIEGTVSFERLLQELEIEADRRDMYGITASPIEKIDRAVETLIFHHPRNGRQPLAFKTARNKLSWCLSQIKAK